MNRCIAKQMLVILVKETRNIVSVCAALVIFTVLPAFVIHKILMLCVGVWGDKVVAATLLAVIVCIIIAYRLYKEAKRKCTSPRQFDGCSHYLSREDRIVP